MIIRRGYGCPADFWSFGCLAYEMMIGHPPFQDQNGKELDRKILNEKVSMPAYLTSPSHALIKGLLNRDVTKRLGCAKSTKLQIGK